jgi:hypothetical protein
VSRIPDVPASNSSQGLVIQRHRFTEILQENALNERGGFFLRLSTFIGNRVASHLMLHISQQLIKRSEITDVDLK